MLGDGAPDVILLPEDVRCIQDIVGDNPIGMTLIRALVKPEQLMDTSAGPTLWSQNFFKELVHDETQEKPQKISHYLVEFIQKVLGDEADGFLVALRKDHTSTTPNLLSCPALAHRLIRVTRQYYFRRTQPSPYPPLPPCAMSGGRMAEPLYGAIRS